MPSGRPSKYQEAYAETAKKLALMGVSDDGIAYFFDVQLEDIAQWAWAHEAFYNAITPLPAERAQYEAALAARRVRINAGKRERLRSNPSARIRNAVSARLWAALRGRTDGRLFSRLGYSINDLISHLEARFKPGMSWQNYGAWHIDHIRPCAEFDLRDPAQFMQCWALRNLQPLWAAENIAKGAASAGA